MLAQPTAEPQKGSSKRLKRGDDTRIALIEMAESMLSEYGIDAVSLRQIGQEIGSQNTNVVAYYFGNKENLVEAVFAYRIPQLDSRRSELLALADEAGTGFDMGVLLDCQWRPVLEQKDRNGRHSYAGLLVSVSRSHWTWVRQAVSDNTTPTVSEITRRMASVMPESLKPLFKARLQLASLMIIAAIQTVDFHEANGLEHDPEHIFRDSLQMASAAFFASTAPP